MKRTSFEIVDLLYDMLNRSDLTSGISGELYKGVRPDNSVLEDIVLNALPVSLGSWQQCTANVNIYIQDLDVLVDGKRFKSPNTVRLEQVTRKVLELLDRGSGEDWICYVTSQGVLRNDEGSHMSNVRVEFRLLTS